jgi:hypothetical protein
MKEATHSIAPGVLVLAFAIALAEDPALARAADGPWPVEKANAWYASIPRLVGCNFSPSTAINQLEMWQADTFDPKTIDRELGWAQDLGFTSVRVFLHDLLWQQDAPGFLDRMDTLLKIADAHKIGVMFVLFDSVWDPNPKLGPQRPPHKGLHNSGWTQSPGRALLEDESKHDSLKPYVQGVLKRFRTDKRVHAWDLMNEPDNTNGSSYGLLEPPHKPELALALLKKVFAWAREIDPEQPLTAGVWIGDWSDAKLNPIHRFQLENSDIITYHSYDPVEKHAERVAPLRLYHRPIVCTEFMARPNGSTFDPVLGWLKKEHIGAYCWGFVAGRTNTIYPWDSWQKPYTSEPKVWFHDIFRPDGTPFDPKEVAYLKSVTGVAKAK